MLHTITLTGLAWSTPDGHQLFDNLNLSFISERTGLVGRNGVGKSTLLKLISGGLRAHAGSISVDGSVGMLRQTVQISADETIADLFGITPALAVLRRADRGEATADELANADWDLESRVRGALLRLDLSAEPETRLARLSGGQRTRAQLAALLYQQPDFLLLDEPTNNLDRPGRRTVAEFLAAWRRGAIVVSHDRELLDTMDAIVELTSLGATRYGGNWSTYRALKAVELAAAEHALTDAERRLVQVERSAQTAAERKARKDRAGAKKSRKGDIPAIALGAHKDRSEVSGGDAARLAERQRTQAAAEVLTARRRIEVLQPLSVTLGSTLLPAGRSVLHIDNVTAGYTQDAPVIRDFSLAITGPERIAVTGPNGAGKTTLLALIAGILKPWRGSIRHGTRFALLDQQIGLLDPRVSIRDNFRRLNPDTDENQCRAALARFMFRADAALRITGTLSGGQLLRAALACVVGGPSPIPFLILDEPTNHLDIDAIEAVETGLRAYDGALLVVSHDEPFLHNIAVTRRFALEGPKCLA